MHRHATFSEPGQGPIDGKNFILKHGFPKPKLIRRKTDTIVIRVGRRPTITEEFLHSRHPSLRP
jgi:hypothetical protein